MLSIHAQIGTPKCCRSSRVCGCFGKVQMRRSMISQRCAIGFQSGEMVGHGVMALQLALTKMFLVRMSLWAGTLLCIKMISGPCCWKGRQHMFHEDLINTVYWSAIRLPWIWIKLMQNISAIPPHTKTLLHPRVTASWTHTGTYHSLRLLSTHAWPSCLSRRNLDLSLNITLAHCLHVHWTLTWPLQTCLDVARCKSWMLKTMMSMDPCITEMPQDGVALIQWGPGSVFAVHRAVWNRLHRWVIQMYQCRTGVIILGRPLLGLSVADPVGW